ncbi:hypothetical protein Tco_0682837 [Tanacetum coccineum]|uniref:Uncharacterized protein n=1 Tax=Tanacetum coccineum TaxID=301880 RepID=A0ABQ4XTF2_9ASTR
MLSTNGFSKSHDARNKRLVSFYGKPNPQENTGIDWWCHVILEEGRVMRNKRKNIGKSKDGIRKLKEIEEKGLELLICPLLQEYGHFANKCPSKKEEQSNLIEEDLEQTLLMATVEEAPGRVGSENLDGGVTESMSRPRIKEDIYAARTPIGRQSVGSITNQKHDQSGFMIDHNNEGGSN